MSYGICLYILQKDWRLFKLVNLATSINHDLVDCDGNDWLVGNWLDNQSHPSGLDFPNYFLASPLQKTVIAQYSEHVTHAKP